jgi:hypothetical protein
MASWVERRWDAAVTLFARHPKKSAAIGLAGAWYPLIFDLSKGFASLLPTWPAVVQAWEAMNWPDWSVTWVTGPIGTGILLLLWWQTRQGRRPFASGGAWERQYSARLKEVHAQEEVDAINKAQEEATRAKTEKDEAIRALKEIKRQYALERVAAFSKMRFGALKVAVTIRFAAYGGDYLLAKQVEKIFEECGWTVDLDGSNQPVLPQAGAFKVVFASGHTLSFNGVAQAFSEGDLLEVPVGQTQWNAVDSHRLVVQILPSAPNT